jgi:formylglycine-generating enzyme required for sulfatase activity
VQPVDLAPGSVFAQDFRIERQLGKGGMGVVYVATQLSTGKPRALKLMQPSAAADPELRDRFVQEARVGALIQSEHVVEVIGAGTDAATGLRWLAMELLDGEDLAAAVRRRGPFSSQEVREVFAQLCHGLAAAHRIPVVHRDLKPENVFLARARREGGGVVVKILDFGIAKIVTNDLTATSTIGTPLWMAPEQTSEHARISPQTDVWALGLIAFFLFTGQFYWRSRGSTMDLMREVLVAPLEPPSSRAGALLAGGRVPAGFDAWFARCVARDPLARFANAADAWAALAPLVSGANAETALAPTAPNFSPVAATLAAPPPPPAAFGLSPVVRTARSPSSGTGWIVALVVGGIGLLGVLGVVVLGVSRVLLSRPSPASPVAAPASSPQGASTASVTMVHFEGGTFFLGSDVEAESSRPRHQVTVAPFDLDVDEVTVKAYSTCVGAGRCATPLAVEGSNYGLAGHDAQPINFIDWNAARSYCEYVGKRLPLEEEWEFAAAGGAKQRTYPWGATPPTPGVCMGRRPSGTCEVGSSAADRTPEGLLDMGGNVSEWTSSRFCPYGDPQCRTPQSMRVARGGSFMEEATSQGLFKSVFRLDVIEAAFGANIGVRCAK